MKKLLVSFSNCQGGAILHFLRKTQLAEHYDMVQYNNWQIILNEQSPDDLMRDAARADIFLFQPTDPLKHGMLSSAEMIDKVVPKSALKLSYAYSFNTGFFPIVKHGQWWTSHYVIGAARLGDRTLISRFEVDDLPYDCARRFAENLAEQSRREALCDLRFAPFILENFQKKHLFLMENHPTSELFVHMARTVLRAINPAWDQEIPFDGPNDANLPGWHFLHPAVKRELGIEYDAPGGDIHAYRKLMVEITEKNGVL